MPSPVRKRDTTSEFDVLAQERHATRPPGRGGLRKNSRLPTERKYVTILRADLHRSTDLVNELELEERIDRLAPALEEMRAAVHGFGGLIHRELRDGAPAGLRSSGAGSAAARGGVAQGRRPDQQRLVCCRSRGHRRFRTGRESCETFVSTGPTYRGWSAGSSIANRTMTKSHNGGENGKGSEQEKIG
jgi:class 3 adenylate cyclase